MRRGVLVALAAALVAPACGAGDAATQEAAPPPRVATQLVPSTLRGGLGVRAYEGKEAREAFARAGDAALVADAKIWEIRRGSTLVGVLQISTVRRRVDLSDEDQRTSIGAILAGSVKRIDVEGVSVSFAETPDQIRYLWFGADFFEVLTLKSSQVDAEATVTDLIRFQVGRPEWRPLPEARS